MRMPADNPNRRRHPRLAVSIPVTGTWKDPDGKPKPLEATLVLLSEGGAQLRCNDSVPANAHVEFGVKLGLVKRFRPHGVVRWWRRVGEQRDLGVEFHKSIKPIGEWVRRELRKAGRDTD